MKDTIFLLMISNPVVSDTYCVVFLIFFSSSCVSYVASLSGLYFFDCHLRCSLMFIYLINVCFEDILKTL